MQDPANNFRCNTYTMRAFGFQQTLQTQMSTAREQRQLNFKRSACINKQRFQMIDSWLNLFYPRGWDIFNEDKHLSPLYPTGNHMTSVKNKNSLFLIPTRSNW